MAFCIALFVKVPPASFVNEVNPGDNAILESTLQSQKTFMIITHVFAMAALIVSFLVPVNFSSAKQISTIIAMGLQVANFIFCCDLMFVGFEDAGINTVGNEMCNEFV